MKPTIKLHSFIHKAAGNPKIPAAQFFASGHGNLHALYFIRRMNLRKLVPDPRGENPCYSTAQLQKLAKKLRYLAILSKGR